MAAVGVIAILLCKKLLQLSFDLTLDATVEHGKCGVGKNLEHCWCFFQVGDQLSDRVSAWQMKTCFCNFDRLPPHSAIDDLMGKDSSVRKAIQLLCGEIHCEQPQLAERISLW